MPNEIAFALKPEIQALIDPKNMTSIAAEKSYSHYEGKGGLYCFWWTGNKEDFYSKAEGHPVEKTNDVYTNWQILDLPHVPLYAGRTSGYGRNRLHFHSRFHLRYADIDAPYYRQGLNNIGLIWRITRDKKNIPRLEQILLSNVAFSFVHIADVVERFYLEAFMIGVLKPYFNRS